jgi:hypothetical protein
MNDIAAALDQVGARLKLLRTQRGITLTRVPRWFGSTGDEPADAPEKHTH